MPAVPQTPAQQVSNLGGMSGPPRLNNQPSSQPGTGSPGDWWQNSQFSQGGKFYAPTYSENTTGEARSQSNYNMTPTNQYGVKSMSDPSGTKQWMTQPGDQSFIDTYGKGGRAGDDLAIDPNNPNQATRSYEMTPEQRQQTGMNNGRITLTYHLDPKTGQWTADPNSMKMDEAQQNESNRVIAGRAGITMAAMALGGAAAGGMFGGAGAAASAAGAVPDAAAAVGTMGGTIASGAGGVGAAEYAAGTEALFGAAPEMAAAGEAPFAYAGPGSSVGTGATGTSGTSIGMSGEAVPAADSSPGMFDQVKSAYNTYNRGRQVANVGQRLAGGDNRSALGAAIPLAVSAFGGGSGMTSLSSGVGNFLSGGAGDTANRGAALADPFASQRGQYQQQLSALMADPNSVTKTPGYQFNFDQGMQGLQRQEAASGNLNSGTADAAAVKYGEDYAMKTFTEYESMLTQLAGGNLTQGNAGQVYAGANAPANSATSNFFGTLMSAFGGGGKGDQSGDSSGWWNSVQNWFGGGSGSDVMWN